MTTTQTEQNLGKREKGGRERPPANMNSVAGSEQQEGEQGEDGTERALERVGRRARLLGWFSVGLGAAQVLAPQRVARLVGVRPDSSTCMTLRLIGARELLAGAGLLRRKKPTGWLWSRVVGDVMDLALLASVVGSTKKKRRGRVTMAIAAVAGVTLVDLLTSRQFVRHEAASKRKVPLLGTITIDKSPEEVYAYWRNFQNLPRFMTEIGSVQVLDQIRSHWTMPGPGRKVVEWDATVTADRPNELIAWRTLDGSDLASEGQVRFVRAPGGRGTEVHLKIRVEAPGGAFGQVVGKLVRKLPETMLSSDLRRLKQILEVGEVVQSDASVHTGPHAARPASNQTNPNSNKTA